MRDSSEQAYVHVCIIKSDFSDLLLSRPEDKSFVINCTFDQLSALSKVVGFLSIAINAALVFNTLEKMLVEHRL